jgi:predicted RNase H-like HicB family nuclease
MDKEKILKATTTRWDKESQAYVVESPELISVIGVGDTKEEAMMEFRAHLNLQYKAYKEGRHGMFPRKVGRPALGRVSLTTRLKPDIKEALEQLAKLHHKSQGEIIEILIEKIQRKEVIL